MIAALAFTVSVVAAAEPIYFECTTCYEESASVVSKDTFNEDKGLAIVTVSSDNLWEYRRRFGKTRFSYPNTWDERDPSGKTRVQAT